MTNGPIIAYPPPKGGHMLKKVIDWIKMKIEFRKMRKLLRKK